jgi:four helix bundle protein
VGAKRPHERKRGLMKQQNEMVIFTRTFDLLTWLLPATNHLPRAHRQTFTRRMLDCAFNLRERLEEANLRQNDERLEKLAQADEELTKLRVYVRLAVRWKWFSEGQYEHAAKMIVEIGKLLGGWKRSVK